MKQPFESATLRLTGWYLIILASISLLFSVVVYQVATGEIERRLVRYQDKSFPLMQPAPRSPVLDSLRSAELADSKASVISILVYVNIAVLAAGGGMSYLLARRTLRPIEEAHEAQARFVSDASHELRTPLTAMTTELEVALADSSLKKDEMRHILASNLEEVQRLNKLSSTLLTLSSGDTQALPQQPFVLADSLHRVLKQFNQPAGRIQLHAPQRSQQVVGNQSAIEELLTILIDNALKYSPPDSTVTISAVTDEHRVLTRITNSGEGIAPEHLPHIFERFYRADEARTGGAGYGLGLALAQQISDLHTAHLSVESTPGGMTEFSFSLPILRKSKAKNQ